MAEQATTNYFERGIIKLSGWWWWWI